MKNLIQQVRMKMGKVIKVVNAKRRSNASKEYNVIWVEQNDTSETDGKDEYFIMLTDRELKKCRERAQKNQEDLTSKTFMNDLLGK